MSKKTKISNGRENYAFPNALVLKNHEYNDEGILWKMDHFKLWNKYYALEPGYIQNKDGSIELIEISIVEFKMDSLKDEIFTALKIPQIVKFIDKILTSFKK